MALKGSLKDFSAFDILELIHLKKKTGILFVTSSEDTLYEFDKETIILGFDKGDLVLAESTAKKLEIQLGKVLVKSGRLTEANLEEGMAIQRESLERLGAILCREDFCSEADISDAIHVQMRRNVFTLLRWEQGSFALELQDSLQYFHEVVAPIKVNRLLMEAAVIMDEWPRIKESIHSLDMVFRCCTTSRPVEIATETESFEFEEDEAKITDPSDGQAAIHLNAEEGSVYTLFDGNRSLREVINQTFLSEFVCCKVVYDLLKKELIEVVADGPYLQYRIIPTRRNHGDKASPQEAEPIRWSLARSLFQGSLPGAIVLGITLSNEKAIVLQGKTKPESWPRVVLPILKAVGIFSNGAPIGSLEYITQCAGLALFWNLNSDYMLVVATPLTGKTATSRFRAHVATVVGSFINRS